MKCPHGKTLTSKRKLGITLYYHEDNKECKLMNAGNVSNDKLSEVYWENNRFNPASLEAMATINSKATQKQLVEYVREEPDVNKVANLMNRYYRIDIANLFAPAAFVLVEEFGYWMVEIMRHTNQNLDRDITPFERIASYTSSLKTYTSNLRGGCAISNGKNYTKNRPKCVDVAGIYERVQNETEEDREKERRSFNKELEFELDFELAKIRKEEKPSPPLF